jgi:hypothetical protein
MQHTFSHFLEGKISRDLQLLIRIYATIVFNLIAMVACICAAHTLGLQYRYAPRSERTFRYTIVIPSKTSRNFECSSQAYILICASFGEIHEDYIHGLLKHHNF